MSNMTNRERASRLQKYDMGGTVIVQPATEPRAFAKVKAGKLIALAYFRWTSWGIGVEILSAGVAVQICPLLIAICHRERQIAKYEAAIALATEDNQP